MKCSNETGCVRTISGYALVAHSQKRKLQKLALILGVLAKISI